MQDRQQEWLTIANRKFLSQQKDFQCPIRSEEKRLKEKSLSVDKKTFSQNWIFRHFILLPSPLISERLNPFNFLQITQEIEQSQKEKKSHFSIHKY